MKFRVLLLLAGTHQPRASGFFPQPLAFISTLPLVLRPQQKCRQGDRTVVSCCIKRSTPSSTASSSSRSAVKTATSRIRTTAALAPEAQALNERQHALSTRTIGPTWAAAASQTQTLTPRCNLQDDCCGSPSTMTSTTMETIPDRSSFSSSITRSPTTTSSTRRRNMSMTSGGRTASSSTGGISSRRRGTSVAAAAMHRNNSASSPYPRPQSQFSGPIATNTTIPTQQMLVLAEGGGGDDDPTAASHCFLGEFLGMSTEELQQLSVKYRSLPPGLRGPDEITVAGPELAAAAAKAAEAAATRVVAEAAAAATVPSFGGGEVGEVDGTLGGGRGEREKEVGERRAVPADEAAAVKVAADRAATAAAGRVLIGEAPAVASVLHVQLGVPKERVKHVLLKWPRLLEVSGHRVMQCVRWLAETVGMNKEEVAKVLLLCPPLLIKSVDFQLKPNLKWLEDDLGLTRPETRKVVGSVPQLLTKSVAGNLLPKLEFLDKVVGIRGRAVGNVLVVHPQLFNSSLENMTWKARWLQEELEMNHYQMKRALTRCPCMFHYSAEQNLVPTLEFFMNQLGATRAQVREAIIKQPRLLGMSLDGRLKPRLRDIQDAGFTPSWELHHKVILFASDFVFRRWLREEPTVAAKRRRAAQGGLSQTGRRRH